VRVCVCVCISRKGLSHRPDSLSSRLVDEVIATDKTGRIQKSQAGHINDYH